MNLDERDLQSRYYAHTAASYDESHVEGGGPHSRALEYISGLVQSLGLQSILDVGSGTGRAARWLQVQNPEARVIGIEPVFELIEQAKAKGVPLGTTVKGSGERLPFEDEAFDAVCSFGLMHHVPDPDQVQSEMTRCATRAVFISDSNRFGQGTLPARLAKLGLYVSGTWPLFDYIRTRGRGYMTSEGDGLFYSYSVYDTLVALQRWADRVALVPTNSNTGHARLAAALAGAPSGSSIGPFMRVS